MHKTHSARIIAAISLLLLLPGPAFGQSPMEPVHVSGCYSLAWTPTPPNPDPHPLFPDTVALDTVQMVGLLPGLRRLRAIGPESLRGGIPGWQLIGDSLFLGFNRITDGIGVYARMTPTGFDGTTTEWTDIVVAGQPGLAWHVEARRIACPMSLKAAT